MVLMAVRTIAVEAFTVAALLTLTLPDVSGQTYRLDSLSGLSPVNVKAQPATYRGRQAIRVLDEPGPNQNQASPGPELVTIDGAALGDGTIELDIAAAPRAGAAQSARGFAGLAFRVQPGGKQFECFYLRPTNARADDQLRRNHTLQYISEPDFPWERLRQQSPGVYESYADMEPGLWTHVKIVVEGTNASLYVNNASQPALIVKDLKLGKASGKVALWIGPDTDAYFSDLKVKAASR